MIWIIMSLPWSATIFPLICHVQEKQGIPWKLTCGLLCWHSNTLSLTQQGKPCRVSFKGKHSPSFWSFIPTHCHTTDVIGIRNIQAWNFNFKKKKLFVDLENDCGLPQFSKSVHDTITISTFCNTICTTLVRVQEGFMITIYLSPLFWCTCGMLWVKDCYQWEWCPAAVASFCSACMELQ